MSHSTLPLRDNSRVYGSVSRFLHWSIAALLAWQYLTMILKVGFGLGPRDSAVVASHSSTGAIVFVLIVIRVIWAVINAGNRPHHGGGLLGIAAKAGHGLLYLAMLIVPLVALLRAFGSGRGYGVFGVPVFPTREAPIQWMVDLAGAIHGELGWVMGVLILGHIIMVGVHEAMWKDGTLAKMAGRRALR